MIDPFPESRPGFNARRQLAAHLALANARRATDLPPGLTEQGVASVISAIGARLDEPDLTPRDVVITAYLALQRAEAATRGEA